MADRGQSWTLAELAQLLGGECQGDPGLVIRRPGQSDSDDSEALTFAENAKFLKNALASSVGAVLIGPELAPIAKPAIVVPSARRAFGQFLHMCQRAIPTFVGIHPTAVVSDQAEIADRVSIGPYAVVEAGAVVATGCRIFAHAYVGEGCVLHENVTLLPHVVLVQDVEIGPGSVVHPGSVLGDDGFGYYFDGKVQHKIPQVGGVKIGQNVEIGSLTAIDRATAGETSIGNGTKIDNLVQVAHNVRIGSNTVVASQVGFAGSSRVGDRVTVAGQSATSTGVIVGDDITLGGRTGVTKNLTTPGAYWETPAMPYTEALKMVVAQRGLPELVKRVKALEKEIELLKKEGTSE